MAGSIQSVSPFYSFAVPFCRNGVVLDVGCGQGYGACYLADNDAKFVYGVDSDSEAIQFARERFQRLNLRFLVTDFTSATDFPARHFDCICCSEVPKSEAAVQRVVQAAQRLLHPQGTLALAAPPIGEPALRLEQALGQAFAETHCCVQTAANDGRCQEIFMARRPLISHSTANGRLRPCA